MSNKTILSVAVAAICASSVIYIIGTAENTTTDLSNQKTSVITENINKVSSINKRSLTILPPDISLIPTMKPLKFQKSSLFSVEKSHSFYKQKRLHKNGELFFSSSYHLNLFLSLGEIPERLSSTEVKLRSSKYKLFTFLL